MNKESLKNHNQSEYDIYEDVERIKSALSTATRDLKGRAGEILTNSFEDMKETTAKVGTSAGDYVSNKPLQSLGIAFLIGATLGLLLRRK